MLRWYCQKEENILFGNNKTTVDTGAEQEPSIHTSSACVTLNEEKMVCCWVGSWVGSWEGRWTGVGFIVVRVEVCYVLSLKVLTWQWNWQ